MLGTYQPGEFIFHCPIFMPSQSVYGVLKARILRWFAILFFSGPRFVRTLHHDPSVLGGPTRALFPDALSANSPEYLVLPEPLQPKQLHHLHTWPSQGYTQALQGSLRRKPQWTTYM